MIDPHSLFTTYSVQSLNICIDASDRGYDITLLIVNRPGLSAVKQQQFLHVKSV